MIIVNLSKCGNNCFGELVHLNFPFLEHIYTILGCEAADMKEYPFLLKVFVNQVDCLFEVSWRETVKGCLLKDTVHLEVRPLLGDINTLPANSSFQISLFALLLVY